MVGKRLVQKALDVFHARFPDTEVELSVRRHPYSWAGDDRSVPDGKISYKDMRKEKGYEEMDVGKRPKLVPIDVLGKRASVTFDFDVGMKWHPVDSHRMIGWASRAGRQEEYVDALGVYHFERRRSCADRDTLLAAAGDVGLDPAAAAAFLDSGEGTEEVWASFRRMLREYGILSIPLFVFTATDRGGVSPFGPRFDPNAPPAPYVIVGSASVEWFVEVFERIHRGLGPLDEPRVSWLAQPSAKM